MEALFVLEEAVPLLVAIGAFAITYGLIPSIIDVSHLKHLFDDPEDERKLHVSAIPNLGGVAIFAAVFIVFAVSGYALQPWSPYLAAGLTLLFFSGLKDDILVIDPYKKLLIQILAVLLLMVGGNMVITNMGGIFGLHEIAYEAGFGLTFFTMIVVLNAYNLIDGIDGLASGVGAIASLFFGWWFWEAGMMAQSVFAFIIAGSLLAFLRFNFQPASIFMGDTGSQVVGYSLAFLAVAFVEAGVTSPVEVPYQEAVPVLVLSVLIVPLYDTLRVFLFRALRGESPFKADRRHVHHQLIDMGFSHRAACYILYAYTFGIIGMTLTLSWMGVNALLAVVLFTTVLLFPTTRIKRRLLKRLGINMPSRRQIQVMEMKYGMSPKTVGTKADHKEVEEEKGELEEIVA